jgi:hypothetical protein
MNTQFFKCLLPGFNLLRLEHEEIDTENHRLTSIDRLLTASLLNSTIEIDRHNIFCLAMSPLDRQNYCN